MVEAQFSWDGDVEPVIRKYAKKCFRESPNKEELVNDAVSLGWEWWSTAQKRIKPKHYAYFACLRVKCGRQFQQSERSIETQSQRRAVKPLRVELKATITGRPGDNPAAIARVQLDFAAWVPTLNERLAAYLECVLRGETNREIADKFCVSLARVSQIRRELLDRYHAFTS